MTITARIEITEEELRRYQEICSLINGARTYENWLTVLGLMAPINAVMLREPIESDRWRLLDLLWLAGAELRSLAEWPLEIRRAPPWLLQAFIKANRKNWPGQRQCQKAALLLGTCGAIEYDGQNGAFLLRRMSEFVQSGENLVELSISSTLIDFRSVEDLIRLPCFTRLHTLSLRQNQIQEMSCARLLEGVLEAPNLRVLDLSRNLLDDPESCGLLRPEVVQHLNKLTVQVCFQGHQWKKVKDAYGRRAQR